MNARRTVGWKGISGAAVLGALALVLAGIAMPLEARQYAQNDLQGRITGRVMDAESARPLPGVQVYLADRSVGAITDVNGRYLLRSVPQGTHSVVVESLGYGTKTVAGVEVKTTGTVSLDITLRQQALELEGISVTAERERGSSAYLLDRRRTESALVDALGEAQISRSPDSDAAEVARRMTGVTVSDGKYVFIRGLGQRYSQTALNGSPLPSPEPEREAVPLDLFPSGFLESLTTRKSYTPDQPADFSGGTVEIVTRDFPSEFVVRLGIGTKVNTMSQFENGWLASPVSGDLDFLGLDDGTRAFPGEVSRALGGLEGARLPADPALREQLGHAFAPGFAVSPRATPLPRSLDLSVGGTTEFFDRELGLFLAGTYSDDYAIRDDEVERKFRTSGFDPAIPEDRRQPNVAYTFRRGTRNVNWGFLGNAIVNLTPEHQVGIRSTFNVSTEDEARTYQGVNQEDLGGLVRSERTRYLERLLLWGQLFGEHQVMWDSRVSWRLNGAWANRDEPGLREAIYVNNSTDSSQPYYLEPVGESGRYLYSELDETDLNGEVDWRLPFDLWGGEAAVQVGGAYRDKARGFAARRFHWSFLGGIYTDLDSALAGGQIVGQARQPGEFSISDVVEPGDVYDVEDRRIAGYLMLDLPVTESLQAIAGVRVETYDLTLDARGGVVAERDEMDLAPSLNLIYSLSDEMKLRGAFSHTVDRPEFRELAPFQFTEAASLRQVFGSPDLVPADITSADLRWDWFFAPGEIASAGVFWKRIDNPIEQVFVAAASSAYSFQNGGEGTVLGVELDARVGLDRISDVLEGLSMTSNLSVIDSEVTVDSAGAFLPTNPRRPLEGQASYVLNLGLTYGSGYRGWEAGVFFNRLGERLTAAGGSGIPDIYEQPRNQLDATFRLSLPWNGSLKLKGSNLLDESFVFEQEANGIAQVQRQYSLGRTFSLGLSWELGSR